jgi:hypothetical protein
VTGFSGHTKVTAANGDTTLTRFRKNRNARIQFVAPMPPDATGTRFKKSLVQVNDAKSLLVSAHNNVKIGRDVRKGLFRGYWIYSLSFEERTTCPSTCHHWATCYGNAMPFAKRIDHRDTGLLMLRLEQEIHGLLSVRGREGILVRLHALGDFFSADYVRFWANMLALHDKLAIYGYTAHHPTSEIGFAIWCLKRIYGRRFAIRFSNGGTKKDCTIAVPKGTEKVEGAFICPEQTGKTLACATCGACWSTDKNVAFLDH